MWISGINCWALAGYSIGTSGLGVCLNISEVGNVIAPYKIISPKMQTNTILANGNNEITLDDNVLIIGNLNITGTITASNSNPFWVAGKVNGSTVEKLSVAGRYNFSVTRAMGFAVGIYFIRFNTNYANANYIISLTNESTGSCKVWDVLNKTPTVEGFYVIIYNTSNALIDSTFHFSVIA